MTSGSVLSLKIKEYSSSPVADCSLLFLSDSFAVCYDEHYHNHTQSHYHAAHNIKHYQKQINVCEQTQKTQNDEQQSAGHYQQNASHYYALFPLQLFPHQTYSVFHTTAYSFLDIALVYINAPQYLASNMACSTSGSAVQIAYTALVTQGESEGAGVTEFASMHFIPIPGEIFSVFGYLYLSMLDISERPC